jgi:hypothetical protein
MVEIAQQKVSSDGGRGKRPEVEMGRGLFVDRSAVEMPSLRV